MQMCTKTYRGYLDRRWKAGLMPPVAAPGCSGREIADEIFVDHLFSGPGFGVSSKPIAACPALPSLRTARHVRRHRPKPRR